MSERANTAVPVEIRDTLDALHCGAFVLRGDGRIAHANRRLAEMLGWSREAVVGHDLADLLASPNDRKAIEPLIDCRPAEVELTLRSATGTTLNAVLAARPMRDGCGEDGYRLVTAIDITSLRREERRAQEQYEEISRLSDTILTQALDLKHQSEWLEDRVRERTRELHEANLESIYMLAMASEARDEETGAHLRRIERFARLVARELGFPARHAERIGYSAILHDVGKIAVPDEILKKPGPLTDEEYATLKNHTIVGERILSEKPFFEIARAIARSHHENWDGSGYPDERRGDEIPVAARIVRLVDVFDALVSERVYKGSWPARKAADYIAERAGTWFEPELVRVFSEVFARGSFDPGASDDAAS